MIHDVITRDNNLTFVNWKGRIFKGPKHENIKTDLCPIGSLLSMLDQDQDVNTTVCQFSTRALTSGSGPSRLGSTFLDWRESYFTASMNEGGLHPPSTSCRHKLLSRQIKPQAFKIKYIITLRYN